MIRIPSEKKRFGQNNSSDLLGNISVTKNVSFDNEGYLELSKSPRSAIDTTVDADFDLAAVIVKGLDYDYFVGTWDQPFQLYSEILAKRPTQIADAGVPSTDIETDAAWFNGLLVVSQDTDVDYYDNSANTWTDTNISLTANGQHQTVNFLSLSAIAIVNVNTVKLYASPLTATPTLITTLTINSDFEITSACYFNQNMYVATRNIYGGKAAMYVWNGTGTSASQVYEVDATTIYSIAPHKGTIYALISSGALLKFTGSGFELADAFPIYYTDQSLNQSISDTPMYKNVMKSNGELLYISFTNDSNNKKLLHQPDGIWCLDERVGLYHRYSFSNSLVNIETIATGSVNTTTDQITVVAAPVTGTEVFYKNSGGLTIAGLEDDTKYFTIYVDSTHVKLAETLADANSNTAIDLTGTGNSAQKLIFFPNTDYGATISSRTTAMGIVENGGSVYGTELIWSAEVIPRASSNDIEALGTVSSGVEARGYFITPKIMSENITDTFNNIVVKYSPFTTEMDKIIIKYRLEDDMRKYVTFLSDTSWKITWTSSTTFTTTQVDWADAVVGDEVEVLNGAAGGLLAHITVITENAGTYTVTIDETYSNYTSGDISRAVFRNWKKLMTVSPGEPFNYKVQALGQQGKFIQLKVELRGIGTRIEELLVDNVKLLPVRN